MTGPFQLHHFIAAGSSLVGGVLVGLVVYRFLLRPLVRHSTLTKSGADKFVLGAVLRASVVWFTVAGAYAARVSLPLRPGIATGIDRGLLMIVIASATWVLARIIGDSMKLYALRSSGVLPGSSIFINIARLLVFLVGILVLLQTFGISITPLLTALGVGGLAIALALQDTLSNLFAGLQLLAAKKVRLGDFVKLDSGDEGEVIDINWRNTALRQLPNNIVIVPNARMASAIITNFNMPQPEMAVIVQVGVAYDSDLERVEVVTTDVAKETLTTVPGGVAGFEPFIRYHTFNDFSIDFSVILRGSAFVDQYLLKHEFLKRLHARYAKEGIEIPFPIRTVRFDEADPPRTRGRKKPAARSPKDSRDR